MYPLILLPNSMQGKGGRVRSHRDTQTLPHITALASGPAAEAGRCYTRLSHLLAALPAPSHHHPGPRGQSPPQALHQALELKGQEAGDERGLEGRRVPEPRDRKPPSTQG